MAVSAQIRGSAGIAACGETGSGTAAGYRGHLEKTGGTRAGLRHPMGCPKQQWGHLGSSGGNLELLGTPEQHWGPPRRNGNPEHVGESMAPLGTPSRNRNSEQHWGPYGTFGDPQTTLGTPDPQWGPPVEMGTPRSIGDPPYGTFGDPWPVLGTPREH